MANFNGVRGSDSPRGEVDSTLQVGCQACLLAQIFNQRIPVFWTKADWQVLPPALSIVESAGPLTDFAVKLFHGFQIGVLPLALIEPVLLAGVKRQ